MTDAPQTPGPAGKPAADKPADKPVAKSAVRATAREPGRLALLTRRAWRAIRRPMGGAEEAVAAAIEDQAGRGGEIIGGAQRDMIMNAARFDRLRVADVMKPRAAIMAIDIDATLGEAARSFNESQHSRLPIYRDTLDDPLGFVHVKDILALLTPDEKGAMKAKPADHVISKLKRDILFVPAAMRLPALLLKMQATHIHLALVVDEYGGTDGIVSIEDIVEQIVGAIEDEYDEASTLIQARGPGVFEADARASIGEVERALGVSLALGEEPPDFDTVGGLVAALAGRLPQRGEILAHRAGIDFEVLDADPRRVKRLRIRAAAKGDARES
jgi:CBS domain containing-hemolysin-like protein